MKTKTQTSEDSPQTAEADNRASPCRSADNDHATLPRYARLPINRCNVPPVILGSLTFQHHPAPLHLDSVAEFHADLFRRLDAIDGRAERAEAFRDYMTVHFCLEELEKAGLTPCSNGRAKANWMRLLRGWSFDSDGREGAVLKGWVESRFGLLTRYHGEAMPDTESAAYARFIAERSAGLYGTHALEAQLDLVYTYIQYELTRRDPARRHLSLYRGINQPNAHELLQRGPNKRVTLLLNNLSSFTLARERADEFGDSILEVCVPPAKVFCQYGLLPGLLHGEDEVMVIGGVYAVSILTSR